MKQKNFISSQEEEEQVKKIFKMLPQDEVKQAKKINKMLSQDEEKQVTLVLLNSHIKQF